ncbi:MAG: DUF2341 domain-containing protein [Candidatus Paceibacterota bacterium]
MWSNNFIAVYHLGEDASGTGNADVYKDSTANGFDGDDYNTSNDKTGFLGAGQEFGDDQNDYIRLPKEVLNGRTDITTSWWHQTSNAGDMTIISGANSGQANEYWTRFDNDTLLRIYAQGGQETTTLDDGATYNDGQWQHYVAVSDDAADEISVYRNGESDTENPDPQAISAYTIDTGGLIIGQDQDSVGGSFSTAENFEGQLDELRFASTVRTAAWAAAEYANQANPGGFYATSSMETLNATDFSELDFWVQHFSTSTDEADIWVQVDYVPAGSQTIIYLYYGNSAASSASDELETFTYSTTTDLYYVVDDSAATDISVVSLIDSNEVRIDGGAAVALDQGESTSFTTFSGQFRHQCSWSNLCHSGRCW